MELECCAYQSTVWIVSRSPPVLSDILLQAKLGMISVITSIAFAIWLWWASRQSMFKLLGKLVCLR